MEAMKTAMMIALALWTAGAVSAPALAYEHHDEQVVVSNNGWTPEIIVRHGHHGYWDEHHHWRDAHFVTHDGHRGYYDYRHGWHDWNG
jgi:hypothetical protein